MIFTPISNLGFLRMPVVLMGDQPHVRILRMDLTLSSKTTVMVELEVNCLFERHKGAMVVYRVKEKEVKALAWHNDPCLVGIGWCTAYVRGYMCIEL